MKLTNIYVPAVLGALVGTPFGAWILPGAAHAQANPPPSTLAEDQKIEEASAPAPAAASAPDRPSPAPPPGYTYPPGYGPPPGYAYPPGYGPTPVRSYQPRYYPPPMRVAPSTRGTYRPFTVGLGLGLGTVALYNMGGWGPEMGMSYALRVGFGITPRWLIMLALDGTWTNIDAASYTLVSYTAGAQYFALPWLYLRGGVGLGCSEGDDYLGPWSDCNGQAFSLALGAEFAQTHSTSFAVELVSTTSRYGDTWDPVKQGARTGEVLGHVGLNFVLHLF